MGYSFFVEVGSAKKKKNRGKNFIARLCVIDAYARAGR